MLSTQQLHEILTKVSYKDGWTFEIYDDEFEGPHIFIVAPVRNGYRDEALDIGVRSPIPPYDTEIDFLRWLGWRLRRIESHECREFFRYDGKLVSDPHD